jgi:hypothetical protein
MMLRIKNVKYMNEYKLKVLFSDGKTKIIDFKNWINEGGAYITHLRNIEYFKKVQLDEFNYTICWPNGADFSPEILYEIGIDFRLKSMKRNTKAKSRKHTIKK